MLGAGECGDEYLDEEKGMQLLCRHLAVLWKYVVFNIPLPFGSKFAHRFLG